MKKSSKILLSAALVMIIAAMMIPAWSYFTTYAAARGVQTIHLGENTRINEDFDNWTKKLQVVNEDKNVTVFIRAKAFSGKNNPISYNGTGWTENTEDGYWYCDEPIIPGGVTPYLNVVIEEPKDPKLNDQFNVVVIYESIPARYNADGEAYADWTQKVHVVTEEGGN